MSDYKRRSYAVSSCKGTTSFREYIDIETSWSLILKHFLVLLDYGVQHRTGNRVLLSLGPGGVRDVIIVQILSTCLFSPCDYSTNSNYLLFGNNKCILGLLCSNVPS